MHPYGPGFHHWHRGPSRIVWFFLGAATATWWIKHKEIHGSWSTHCIRVPILPSSMPSGPEAPSSWSPRNIPRSINNIPSAGHQGQSQPWDEEKERVMAVGQQAGDKLAELSEATLDTVLTTVEMLKTKLAEHRAERDKQLEEDRKRSSPS